VISSSRLRIGSIFRAADPSPRTADSPATAQVLERVDGEPHLQPFGSLLSPYEDSVAVEPGGRCRCGRHHAETHSARRRAGVEDTNALAALALGDEALAGLARRLDGLRDPRREVDRDDLATGFE